MDCGDLIEPIFDESQKTYNLCMNLSIQALENKTKWESHYKFIWYPEKKYDFFKETLNTKKKEKCMHS